MMADACPTCGATETHEIDNGRLLRCVVCEWLIRRGPDGRLVTALPAALRSKLPRQRRQPPPGPTDLQVLDELLRS